MFNFHLYNGSIPYRVFMALTVALCIWGIMSLTADAATVSVSEGKAQESHPANGGEPIYHVHEGDAALGTGCYARPIYHEHTGSKKNGSGCYGEPVVHSHSGSAAGGGCYGQSIMHTHSGSAGSGGGCYGQAVTHNHSGNETEGGGCYQTPICHVHQGDEISGGACYATPIYHQHEGSAEDGGGCYTVETLGKANCTYTKTATTMQNSPHTDCRTCVASTHQVMKMIVIGGHVCGERNGDVWGESICSVCGSVTYAYGVPQTTGTFTHEYSVKVYEPGCSMTEETIVGYEKSCTLSEEDIEGYSLACGKTHGSVEYYILSCGKNETDVERYGLNCGLQEGQIVEYKRNCGLTKEDIVGYELSCGMDEQTIVGWTETAQPSEEISGDFVGENKEAEAYEEMKQPVRVPIKLTAETEEDNQNPMDSAITGVKYPDVARDTEGEASAKDTVTLEGAVLSGDMVYAREEAGQEENPQKSEEKLQGRTISSYITDKRLLAAGIILALVILVVKFYLERTVALFYYDEQNRYHSLGRVGYRRNTKGYHIEIGSGIRRKASTDRYRIRTTKNMQKAAKDAHLFVRISSQVLKLGLEEYVDFAL